MVKLLDQYSERLVNILDEKIAASLAIRVRERENSEGGWSAGGMSSPTFERDDERGSRPLAKSHTAESTDAGAETDATTEASSPRR
jgi:hypothetical protein